jgi:diguanylate cyclase (GGDEF)-like protein
MLVVPLSLSHSAAPPGDVLRTVAAAEFERFSKALPRLGTSFGLLVEDAGDGLRIVYVTATVEGLLQYPAVDLLGRRLDVLAGSGEAASTLESLVRAAAPGGKHRQTVKLCAAGGAVHWFDAAVSNMVDDPDIGGWVLILNDADDFQATADRYSALVDRSPDPLNRLAVDGTVLYANPASRHLWARSAYVALEPGSFESGCPRVRPDLMAHIVTGIRKTGVQNGTASYATDDGAMHVDWVNVGIYNGAGELVEVQCCGRDVSQRVSVTEALQKYTLHDQLTLLANRAGIRHVADSASAAGPYSLVLCDLDSFKAVNDTAGHQVGDQLLMLVAERLQAAVAKCGGVAGRLSGDEFCVVVRGPAAQGVAVARDVVAALTGLGVDGSPVRVSASVGVAHGVGGMAPDRLLRQADIAMYAAKRGGKNQFRLFDEVLEAETQRSELLALAAPAALRGDDLTVVFQPTFSALSGVVDGVEALVRWAHPALGLVPADEFVAALEQSGCVLELDRWVARSVVAQVAEWVAAGVVVPRVWINVTPPGLAAIAEVLVAECQLRGVEPARFGVELTERVAVADGDLLQCAVRSLQEHGVRVALDDFGTGQSSLALLASAGVDVLKVDRLFIDPLPGPGNDLVAGVLRLAPAVGAEVVAEGVERVEQANFLIGEGCDRLQGFLLSPPVPPDEVPALLTGPCAVPGVLWGVSGEQVAIGPI